MTIKVSSLQQGPVFTKEHSFITGHRAGLDKIGMDVLPKSAGVVNSGAISAVSYDEGTKLYTITLASHLAKKHNIVRFVDGLEEGNETPIFDVPTVNTIRLYGKPHLNDIQVGDNIQILRYVTPTTGLDGSTVVTVAPSQFVKDGVDTQVIEDSVTPANNRPFPSGLYVIKDGVPYPVSKSTVDAALTMAVPVEIVGLDGTTINVTAGDINVQLTDLGPNFDAARIGDGSGAYLIINPDGSINVVDQAAIDAIDASNVLLTSMQTLLTAISGKLPASLGAKVSASSLSVTLASDGVLPLPTGAATEATLAAMSAKLPASLGQKTSANSMSMVLASDYTLAVDVTGGATEAKQDDQLTELQNIAVQTENISDQLPISLGQKTAAGSLSVVLASGATVAVTGVSTEAKQDSQITLATTLNAKDFATSAKQDTANTALSAIYGQLTTIFAALGGGLSRMIDDETAAVNHTTGHAFTAPVGATHMILSNNADATAGAAGRIRFSPNTPDWATSSGMILGVGGSTALLPAGDFTAIAENSDATANTTVIWFGV